jgi:hypothetical protein
VDNLTRSDFIRKKKHVLLTDLIPMTSGEKKRVYKARELAGESSNNGKLRVYYQLLIYLDKYSQKIGSPHEEMEALRRFSQDRNFDNLPYRFQAQLIKRLFLILNGFQRDFLFSIVMPHLIAFLEDCSNLSDLEHLYIPYEWFVIALQLSLIKPCSQSFDVNSCFISLLPQSNGYATVPYIPGVLSKMLELRNAARAMCIIFYGYRAIIESQITLECSHLCSMPTCLNGYHMLFEPYLQNLKRTECENGSFFFCHCPNAKCIFTRNGLFMPCRNSANVLPQYDESHNIICQCDRRCFGGFLIMILVYLFKISEDLNAPKEEDPEDPYMTYDELMQFQREAEQADESDIESEASMDENWVSMSEESDADQDVDMEED